MISGRMRRIGRGKIFKECPYCYEHSLNVIQIPSIFQIWDRIHITGHPLRWLKDLLIKPDIHMSADRLNKESLFVLQ